MKILVTGANGFIGCHLCRKLVERGHEVKALVRQTSDLRGLKDVPVELVYGDLLQPENLINAASGCKIIYHVAGVFTYSGVPAATLISEAEQGMRHIIRAAAKAGADRLVLTSSSVVFGSSREKIVRTESDQPITVSKDDENAYVRAKRTQLETARSLALEYGIDLVSVHPTLTVGSLDYGLTESNHAIISYLNDPFRASWLGGCNIVSVSDVAVGHILAGEHGISGDAYLLGSENLEWEEVHRLISELCGLPGPFFTAWHTPAYLSAAAHEFLALLSNQRPPATREQARMVGQYYWYSHQKAATLGYVPRPARQALAEAISWLVTSEHVTASVRSTLKLAAEVYKARTNASQI